MNFLALMGDLNEKKLSYFPSLWKDRALIGEWQDALKCADEKAKSQPLATLPNYSDDSIYQLLSKVDTSKPDAVAQLNAVRLLQLGYAESLKNTEAFVRSLIKANINPKRGGGAQRVEKHVDEPFGEVESEKKEEKKKNKTTRKRKRTEADEDDEDEDEDEENPSKKAKANESYRCDFPGCNREFTSSPSLTMHKRAHPKP
jgi:hypothetical protein